MPDLSSPGTNSDFYFVRVDDPESAAGRIIELVKTGIPRAVTIIATAAMIAYEASDTIVANAPVSHVVARWKLYCHRSSGSFAILAAIRRAL
jgi:hypothetical protein